MEFLKKGVGQQWYPNLRPTSTGRYTVFAFKDGFCDS